MTYHFFLSDARSFCIGCNGIGYRVRQCRQCQHSANLLMNEHWPFFIFLRWFQHIKGWENDAEYDKIMDKVQKSPEIIDLIALQVPKHILIKHPRFLERFSSSGRLKPPLGVPTRMLGLNCGPKFRYQHPNKKKL